MSRSWLTAHARLPLVERAVAAVIDAGIQKPWPEDVVDALKRFQQGHLVPHPPFFYFGVPSHPLWEMSVPEQPDEEADVLVAPADAVEWGVITTQTCDLQEEGRNKKPWFAVAPVYRVEDEGGRMGLIRAERITYLTHISALTDGFWVADLRIELPIEKSWLLNCESRDGFATPDESRAFARRLGELRQRPALIGAIYTEITTPLREALDRMSADEVIALRDPVIELALDIAGDPTAPDSVQLVVLTEGACPDETREWFESWWDGARAAAATLTLLRPRFADGSQDGLSVLEYRRMHRLPWADLSID